MPEQGDMASVRSPHDLKLHDSIVEEVLALKLLRRKQVRLAPRTKLVRELRRCAWCRPWKASMAVCVQPDRGVRSESSAGIGSCRTN